jgi:hypothetical protein
MDALERYLQQVMDDMNATWPQYEELRPKDKDLLTQPIPFFGDIKNAKILTVGVNPSATEFKNLRWPVEVSLSYLMDRLIKYFVSEQTKPDDWFDTWIEALKHLEASYQAGSDHLAAHIDLSPRVTKSMGSADPYDFLAMMKADIRWFFELLSIMSGYNAPQLMLFSGTVTKCYYMDMFIGRVAHEHGFQLEKSSPTGKGFGFYYLRGPNFDLPVFFCSVSPSGRTKQKRQVLIDCVKEHKEKLLELMNERPGPTAL